MKALNDWRLASGGRLRGTADGGERVYTAVLLHGEQPREGAIVQDVIGDCWTLGARRPEWRIRVFAREGHETRGCTIFATSREVAEAAAHDLADQLGWGRSGLRWVVEAR